MPSFTIEIDGQKYKTDATSKKAAEEKIKQHLNKTNKTNNKDKSKSNSRGKTSMSNKNTIIEYKILSNESHLSLASTVNGYLKKGWQPQGGVSSVDYQGKGLVGGIGRYEFFQAIVKYSKYK